MGEIGLEKKSRMFWDRYLKYAVLFAGTAAMIYGVMRGEADTVMGKAVAICLECIGIG